MTDTCGPIEYGELQALRRLCQQYETVLGYLNTDKKALKAALSALVEFAEHSSECLSFAFDLRDCKRCEESKDVIARSKKALL